MARPKRGTKAKAEAVVETTQGGQKLPVREKEEHSQSAAAPSQPAQGTLKVFDDDDDDGVPAAPAQPSQTKPAPIPQDDESDDDDDDAPEAVSTQQAASRVKESAQAAQKAALEKAAAQKRKRQQRDALFKQQAEERKTMEEAERAKSAAAAAADEAVSKTEALPGRKRAERMSIPNLLPEEFLDSSSEGEEEEMDDFAGGARPKRRRVAGVERSLKRLDRAPRDERVGSTVYRVAKGSDERLPPKSKKYAQSGKDVLMRRNRPGVRSTGFFKK